MPLVSGYDSDSDSEHEQVAETINGHHTGKRPHESTTVASAALEEHPSKRSKQWDSKELASSGYKHGLLQALPPPKNSAAFVKSRKDVTHEAKSESKISSDLIRPRVVNETQASTSGSSKGNQDFRAMLGGDSAARGIDSLEDTRNRPGISAAPMIAEEVETEEAIEETTDDPYKGWQQGPDGEWFPITPEAHEQYQSAMAQYRMQEAQRAAERGDIAAPANEHDAVTSESAPNKNVNMRARRKGQLSALIAQGKEDKDRLQQRWTKGKQSRQEAQKKYGF